MLIVFIVDREFIDRVLWCVYVVGGVVSLCVVSGLRIIIYCNIVCMIGVCVRIDSNIVDGISYYQCIQINININICISIDDGFCIYCQ